MNKFIIASLATLLIIGSLSACTNRQGNTVAGGVVGGVAGNVLTGGSAAGTAIGAVGGAVIGNNW